jgi:hypothetical protein
MVQASKVRTHFDRAPFHENDWVEYRANPQRQFQVAHCYVRRSNGREEWIVAEINADTHHADDLRFVKTRLRPQTGPRTDLNDPTGPTRDVFQEEVR